MSKSYDPRRFPSGPYTEPTFTKTMRGPKRIGPIGEIVAGDDIEVARAIARIRHPRQKVPPIVYHIKLTGDKASDDAPVVDDGIFVITCTEDQGTWQLYKVELYVTTVSSSGDVVVQLRRLLPDEAANEGEDILATAIQVDEGDLHSDTSDVKYEIDLSKNVFEWRDRCVIDVDSAGTDVRGLSIGLWFSR